MAARGRPASAKTKAKRAAERDFTCSCCGETKKESMFYFSNSALFATHRLPICRECVGYVYKHYVKKYQDERHMQPEKDAIKRVCMGLDIFYSDKLYESAVSSFQGSNCTLLIMQYFKIQQLQQYRNKTYDTTMNEEHNSASNEAVINDEDSAVPIKVIKFFGKGFSNEDYIFLKEQYTDWTARHECKTKIQEELFKRICCLQLEIQKATINGESTEKLDKTLMSILDAAKLQPKQNANETMADNQTWGTLVDKVEQTRPIPEIDEELRDVDKIGKFVDIFYRGHASKAMGLKGNVSKVYEDFIKEYSVNKPEYEGDEDSEALFDAIFGGANIE